MHIRARAAGLDHSPALVRLTAPELSSLKPESAVGTRAVRPALLSPILWRGLHTQKETVANHTQHTVCGSFRRAKIH